MNLKDVNYRINKEFDNYKLLEFYELKKGDNINNFWNYKVKPLLETLKETSHIKWVDIIIARLLEIIKLDLDNKFKMPTNYDTVIEVSRKMVIEKNIDYNNSLYNQDQIFKVDLIDGVRGRLNDKINRINKSGLNELTIDSVYDLIGYFTHYKIMYI